MIAPLSHNTDSRWYALYTRSRHEKCVNEQLARRTIESFLQLRRVTRRWSDRVAACDEPLFKGYLFVRANPFARRDILTLKGAVRYVSAAGVPIPLSEKSIESIRTLVEHAVALEPYPYLNKGDRVAITRGPFKNIEGYIILKDNKQSR